MFVYEAEGFLCREDSCSTDNVFLLGDNTQRYAKPCLVNERVSYSKVLSLCNGNRAPLPVNNE